MSFDLESQLKPELKKVFGVIERNKDYLRGHEILGGGETLKGDLENFYDLEYHEETHMITPKAAITENVLGLGEENKEKYGTKPNELIEILDEFPIKLNDGEDENNFNLLTYEKVRDSFCEPKFPAWKGNLYPTLGFAGIFGGVIGTAWSALNFGVENYSTLTWSVPLALVSIGAVIYAPNKHIKERIKFAEENYSEEREMIKENFQKLHNVAKKVQPFVSQYKSLFT